MSQQNDWDEDWIQDEEDGEDKEPWEPEDRDRITQAVVMSRFRKPNIPLVRLLRDAQIEVFKNNPRKIKEIAKVPLWLSRKLKSETSPTEVMFLLVDSLEKQLESQGQTLELLFESMDSQADRIETLETEINTRLAAIEDILHRLRDKFDIDPPHLVPKKIPQKRPVVAVVGLYPNQFSQVIDHCKRQNIDMEKVELIASPKDTWSLPDICHFAILSKWAGQGWDEIIRKRNKGLADNIPRTTLVHETKGLPMIAMRIAECISRFFNTQTDKY
jgi:hypothetical protein